MQLSSNVYRLMGYSHTKDSSDGSGEEASFMVEMPSYGHAYHKAVQLSFMGFICFITGMSNARSVRVERGVSKIID